MARVSEAVNSGEDLVLEDGDQEESGELNIIEYEEEDDYVDHQGAESHHI